MVMNREHMLQAAPTWKTQNYKVLYFKRHTPACLMVLPFVFLLLCFTGIKLPYMKYKRENVLKLEDSNPCLIRANSYDQLQPFVPTENSVLLPAVATSNEGTEGSNEGKKLGQQRSTSVQEGCEGKLIYTYPLPAEFNEELVDRCMNGYPRYCDKWFCVPCNRLENHGFGPRVPQLNQSEVNRGVKGEKDVKLIPKDAWYRSDQFSVEVIFREKMKEHVCVTDDASEANAFYIPYYGGLDAGFTLFSSHIHIRDELTQRLVGWLSGSSVWQKHKEAPHFMVLGHVAWDFDRKPLEDITDGSYTWGSSLFRQPIFSNVTWLLIERKFSEHDMGLPFPTLFHPSSPTDIFLWQEEVRKAKRPWLVTFVGGSSRKFYKEEARSVRRELMRQCKEAEAGTLKLGSMQLGKCRAVECLGGEDMKKKRREQLEREDAGAESGDGLENVRACEDEPEEVVRALAKSVFCLQPQGDSATRKGFFDTIVAGCIPVLFANTTAYRQYLWHLPASPSLYSVYIPEADVLARTVDVVDLLSRIPLSQVRSMQRAVRHLIPRVVYSPPPSEGSSLSQDAFSITLDALLMQHQ
eukprot:c22074_g1_i2 orf=212-1948(+)